MRLKMRFKFGALLMHELSHAAQYFAIPEECISYELFFEDEDVAEAGCSWENFVFGGRVRLEWNEGPMLDEDCSEWIQKYGGASTVMLEQWPGAYSTKVEDWSLEKPPMLAEQPDIVTEWRVEIDFLEKLFTTSFWSNEVDEKGSAAFRPQRVIGLRYRYSQRVFLDCTHGDDEGGVPEDSWIDSDGHIYPYLTVDWTEWEGFGRLMKIQLYQDEYLDPYDPQQEGWGLGWDDLDFTEAVAWVESTQSRQQE